MKTPIGSMSFHVTLRLNSAALIPVRSTFGLVTTGTDSSGPDPTPETQRPESSSLQGSAYIRSSPPSGKAYRKISNIWRSHNLKPHLRETFKLSRDPRFLEKLTDVVGRYLNPPPPALVLCVDEKSQIQALDRTQPGLPLKKGRCGTMTHDYKRHGTTTLFAALDVLQGKVIGHCYARHRHQEFVRFLRRLDHEFPGQTP